VLKGHSLDCVRSNLREICLQLSEFRIHGSENRKHMATDDFDIYFARAAALYQLSVTSTPEDKSVLKQSPCFISPSKLKSNVTALTFPQQQPSETADLQPSSSPSGPSSDSPAVAVLSSAVNSQHKAGHLHPPRRSASCKYPAGNRRRFSPRSCLQSEADDDRTFSVEIAAQDLTTRSSALSPSYAEGLVNVDDSVAALEDGAYRICGVGLCNGRLGATTVGFPSSAAVLAARGAPRTCNSAPHSRSSSWRKARRPRDSLSQWNQNAITNGVSLESEVIEKLQQLKLMQASHNYVGFCVHL